MGSQGGGQQWGEAPASFLRSPRVSGGRQEGNPEGWTLCILLYVPKSTGEGGPGARPAGTVRTTWSVCGAEVEDEAASRLLGGLAVPQGEVVHAEHAGLVFRGQEPPAGRKVWFLPSPRGTGHRGRAKGALPLCVSGLAGRKLSSSLVGPQAVSPGIPVSSRVESCCIGGHISNWKRYEACILKYCFPFLCKLLCLRGLLLWDILFCLAN